MKSLLIIILLLVASCKSTEPTKSTDLNQNIIQSETLNCPENGTCEIEIIPNKIIEFKSDKFGNLYPEISEGTKREVFKK